MTNVSDNWLKSNKNI